MNKVFCALLVLAAPALFAADPTVAFTPAEVVITVTPGASVAYMLTSRGSAIHGETSIVVKDEDGDGVIRVARSTNPNLTRHSVLVTDLATGAFAYAAEGTGVPGLFPLPRGTILRGPSGAYTELVLSYTGMEIVWVRPGVSSWKMSVDGIDSAPNGLFFAEPKDFVPMTGAPAVPVPAAFERGDVLLVLYRSQGANAGTVNADLDDRLPGSVSFYDPGKSVTEGGSLVVKLMRLRNTNTAATVRIVIDDDDADGAGVRYEPFDSVVEFAAGEIFKEIAIRTIDDQVWSDRFETTLRFGVLDNATPGNPSTLGIGISENDPIPTLGFEPAPADIIETDAPATIAFTVRKQNATSLPATARVDWDLSGPNRIATGSVEVAFAPNETQKTVEIPVPGNDVFEGTRTITVELENIRGAVARFDERTRTIKVKDDELPEVTATGNMMIEGLGPVMLAGMLKAVPYRDVDRPITLTWRTVDGTAKAGSDYPEMSGTITNFDGEENVNMKAVQDEEIEGDEVFYIEIVSATGAHILNKRAAVTIRDNSYPEVVVGATTVVEGGPGARTNGSVRLFFSRPTVFPSVLSLVRVRDLYSAATAGTDYDGSWEGAPIYIPEGRTFVDVIVPILGDDEAEGTELLRLQTGLSLGFRGTKSGILTIHEDDPGPAVTHVYLSGGESTEGPNRSAVFSVGTFDRQPGVASVSWRTEDGTAIAGSDYVASSGTIEFGAQDSTKLINVPLIDDGDDENDETFSVVLHTPVNATIDRNRITSFIRDNDLPAAPRPVVTVGDAIASESTGAGSFTLTLSAAWPVPVIVEYRTQSGGLFSIPSDFVPIEGSVTFAPGERTKSVTFPVLDDPFYDPNEKVLLNLWSGIAQTPVGPTTITIEDDEGIPKRRGARQ